VLLLLLTAGQGCWLLLQLCRHSRKVRFQLGTGMVDVREKSQKSLV
jgi:hypothetical protein